MQATANLLHTSHPESSRPSGLTSSRKRLWTGRILSGLSGLFLLFDGLIKVLMIAPVVEGSQKLGYPPETMLPIGVIMLIATILYLVPRTAFFGALLLTGHLGGAIATHVRVGDPLFSHTLFPVYLALLLWAGLTLRDPRLEALVRNRPDASKC
jgi:hypothetical protein